MSIIIIIILIIIINIFSQDILENEDVKLDNMFIASLVGDIIRVGISHCVKTYSKAAGCQVLKVVKFKSISSGL
jgi:hypothetical protein